MAKTEADKKYQKKWHSSPFKEDGVIHNRPGHSSSTGKGETPRKMNLGKQNRMRSK